MTLRTSTLFLAGLVALAACSGSTGSTGGSGGGNGGSSAGGSNGGSGGSSTGGSGGSGGGTGGPIPIDQVCNQLLTIECAYLTRCGLFSNATGCTQSLLFNGGCATDQFAGIDAGRVRYDGAQAAMCLTAVQNSACDGLQTLMAAACNATFVGLVPPGGGCGYSTDCAPGSFCQQQSNVCGGLCAAKIAVGQPVGANDVCVDNAGPVGGICVQGLPAGSSCDNPDGGFEQLPCSSPATCEQYLIDAGVAVSKCSTNAATGAPCVDFAASVNGCNSFNSCDPMTNRCIAPFTTGTTCDPISQLGSNCQLDLTCYGGSNPPKCQAVSPTGGACVLDSDCAAGLCDGGVAFNPDGGAWTPGACVPLPGLNGNCADIQRCAGSLICDSTSGTCIAPKADGQPCVNHRECKSDECNQRDAGGSTTCGACE